MENDLILLQALGIPNIAEMSAKEKELNYYDYLFLEDELMAATPFCSPDAPPWPADFDQCQFGVCCAETWVAEAHLKLLQSIMGACNLMSKDWALLPKGSRFAQLRAWPNCQYIGFFGSLPIDFGIGIQLPLYHPIKFQDKILIRSHSLAELASSKEYKGLLWKNALQPLFTGSKEK